MLYYWVKQDEKKHVHKKSVEPFYVCIWATTSKELDLVPDKPGVNIGYYKVGHVGWEVELPQ